MVCGTPELKGRVTPTARDRTFETKTCFFDWWESPMLRWPSFIRVEGTPTVSSSAPV